MTIFQNPKFGEVRIIKDENNSPWFVGKDIASILGYSNATKAVLMHVDEEDKLHSQIGNTGQNRDMLLINESGLFSLILSSKLPQAKSFKHWVTSEVLPAIRKDGGYIAASKDDTPEAIMARGYVIAQETLKRIEEENKILSVKAKHLDEVILCGRCYTTTQIAKDLGMTVHELTDVLLSKHIIYRQSGQYMLYAEYASLDLAKNRTAEKVMEDGSLRIFAPYLVWTEKGRAFINNLVRLDPAKMNHRLAIEYIQPTLF